MLALVLLVAHGRGRLVGLCRCLEPLWARVLLGKQAGLGWSALGTLVRFATLSFFHLIICLSSIQPARLLMNPNSSGLWHGNKGVEDLGYKGHR